MNIPREFVRFTLERVVYFWIGPPQANIVAGYDLMIARHVAFLLPAMAAFAGLWLTLRNRKQAGFLLACFLLDLSASVLSGKSVPALQTCDRTGDDSARGLFVLRSKPDSDPLAALRKLRTVFLASFANFFANFAVKSS